MERAPGYLAETGQPFDINARTLYNLTGTLPTVPDLEGDHRGQSPVYRAALTRAPGRTQSSHQTRNELRATLSGGPAPHPHTSAPESQHEPPLARHPMPGTSLTTPAAGRR
jgi:hypothetical protein